MPTEHSRTTARVTRWAFVLSGAIVAVSLSAVPARVADAVSPSALGGLLAGDHGDDSRNGSIWVVNRDRGELAIFDAETGI